MPGTLPYFQLIFRFHSIILGEPRHLTFCIRDGLLVGGSMVNGGAGEAYPTASQHPFGALLAKCAAAAAAA